MDTFVKRGNEMWEIPAKEQYQNQQCLPQVKKKNVQVKINIILNYRKYVNTSPERTLDY